MTTEPRTRHGFLVAFVGAAFLVSLSASCVSAPPSEPSPAYPAGRSDIIAQALEEWDEARLAAYTNRLRAELESWDRPEPYLSYWLAKRYKKLGDLAAYERWLGKALAVDPSFARAYFERGILNLWDKKGGDRSVALADLRKAAELAPHIAEYTLTLADQLRWDKAFVVELEALLSRHAAAAPLSVKGRAWWATWLAEAGRMVEARAKAAEAQSLAERGAGQYEANEAVVALFKVGLEVEGSRAFDAMERRSLNDPWAWWSLGRGLFEAGRYGESARAYDRGRAAEGRLYPDMGFHAGMARLFAAPAERLAGPERELAAADLSAFLGQAGAGPEAAAARLALGLLGSPGFVRDVSELERATLEHWGHPAAEKRKYYDWLDRILRAAGR